MTSTTTKPPRARKKPAAGPLRLVVDNLSADDRELLSYFHGIAHEVRRHVLDVVRHVSVSRPLVEPTPERSAPGICLVSTAVAGERP
ncbi:hypothetical protein SAMN05428959_10824 [Duganella sp. CF517]|uniref:hypothetical protein n=1 Tax=Duganella sp. CF517 TaxID=1881038 RepID=UPI0008BD3B41|nr:hypothetical protein [Duganella sp. CF517]SEO43947.1 hypothetical protein SAMN05428959_10824 [Duganella sp. CF517]